MHLELPSSHNDSRPEESEDDDDIDDDDDEAFVVSNKKKVLTTQETQTSLEQHEQYHPNPDKLKVRKTRHRRTSSHGSPRLSPMRERKLSSNSPRRSQGSYADLESYDTEKQPVPIRFFHHQKSTSSLNGNLTPTSPEDAIFPKRFSTSSSNSSSEADDCQIDHDDVNDDILETLDRKVSEVINRSRLNSSNSLSQTMNNTSDKYGPLSFSYNKKNSPSPNKRLSPMTGASGMVRFGSDDEGNDGGHLTDDSSIDENESRLQWSDDDEEVVPPQANVPNALGCSATSDSGTVNNAVFMMRKR